MSVPRSHYPFLPPSFLPNPRFSSLPRRAVASLSLHHTDPAIERAHQRNRRWDEVRGGVWARSDEEVRATPVVVVRPKTALELKP